MLSSCHPPTSVVLISHNQMKNKLAAGILGNHGALTKPKKKEKKTGMWSLSESVGCSVLEEAKTLNSLPTELFAIPSLGTLVEAGDDMSGILTSGNEVQHVWLIKIVINSFITSLLSSQKLSTRI